MRIEQLEHVLAINEERSINKAAEKLFISQPNLSLSLKNLEDELGYRIFERSRQGVWPTDNGREFLSLARSTVEHYAAFTELSGLIGDNAPRAGAPLRVACQYLHFPEKVFLSLVSEHQEERVRFSYNNAPFEKVLSLVSKREADLGLVAFTKGDKKILLKMMSGTGLKYKRLADASVVVLVGPQNPLFDSESGQINVRDLYKWPTVSYPDAYYSFSSGYRLRQFLDDKKSIEVSDWSMIFDIVSNTPAIAISMLIDGVDYSNPDFRMLTIESDNALLELGWVYSESFHHTDLSSEFTERVEKLVSGGE